MAPRYAADAKRLTGVFRPGPSLGRSVAHLLQAAAHHVSPGVAPVVNEAERDVGLGTHHLKSVVSLLFGDGGLGRSGRNDRHRTGQQSGSQRCGEGEAWREFLRRGSAGVGRPSANGGLMSGNSPGRAAGPSAASGKTCEKHGKKSVPAIRPVVCRATAANVEHHSRGARVPLYGERAPCDLQSRQPGD